MFKKTLVASLIGIAAVGAQAPGVVRRGAGRGGDRFALWSGVPAPLRASSPAPQAPHPVLLKLAKPLIWA